MSDIHVLKKARMFSARQFLRNHGIIVGFLIIVVLLSAVRPNFLRAANLINVLRQVSCIGMATLGVGMLIIMNQIDLSIGSTFALAGVIAGVLVSTSEGEFYLGLPSIVGYAAGIGISMLAAFVAGGIISKARIPAFIVTMGMMSISRGLAQIIGHGMPVGGFPDAFNYLGSASLGPIPWPVIVYVIAIIATWYILNKRPLGRYIYAIGSNEEAARAAGINVDMVKIKTYLIHGVLVGLGSVILAARLKSASPAAGNGYELDAIAGCIIGGVSFTGGIGNVSDMVIGALLLGVISNGMDLLGVSAFYKLVVKGSIIIIAVLIDRKRSGRG
jgi:ribose/xylose/arabinose/galactoside ABC-type transport system permease subunit